MGACLALALLVLMPRFFYHAHLATLDAPIASLWLATLYAQWRAHQRASHAWLAAALAGLALLTKLNAFFLVVPLGLSWGVQLGRTLRRPDRLRRLGPFFTRRTLPLLLLPPSILLLGWPWLWPAPWSRFVDYLQFHRQHFDIAVMVFGERLRTGPPHFPLLMLALTTPPVVLVGVLAAIRPLWRDRARIALFVFIPGLAASMGPLMLPGVPRYDGVRLFLPALPLLAAAAAIGLYSLCAARALWVSRVATLAVVVLVASAAAALGHHHPYPFAYWNAFIGGTRGAYAAGFDIDYFGSSYRQLLPRLAGAEPRRLHILGRVPESSYRQLGIIGPRVQLVGEGEARYFATINRPALFSPRLRALWREGLVVAEVALDGVPLSRVLVERERVGGPTGPRIK